MELYDQKTALEHKSKYYTIILYINIPLLLILFIIIPFMHQYQFAATFILLFTYLIHLLSRDIPHYLNTYIRISSRRFYNFIVLFRGYRTQLITRNIQHTTFTFTSQPVSNSTNNNVNSILK